ncbi:hypothetical protein GGI22_002177, partial [Coemansia erecta]
MSETIEDAVAAWIKLGKSAYEGIEQAKQAAAKLRGFGLCGLCILRYIRLPVGSIYHKSTAHDICLELGVDTEQSQRDQPCTACLGVLSLELAASIAERYKADEFDAQDVSVGVELPKSIYLRH